MKVSTGPEQAKTIRLNRSHVELCSKYFDAALEDAKNVLLDDPRNEKALFRAARALYELRRFSDSQSYLQKLIALYPKNGRAVEDMRKLHQRMREETGDYDYAGMLKEATSCSTLDRGSYIGPVEIKQSQNRGRGLFLTKDVKAGDLLLAEKAFSVISLGQADQPDMAETIHKARRSLAKDCISQLRRNPSLVSAFSNLYTGSRPHEDPNPSRERENLDR